HDLLTGGREGLAELGDSPVDPETIRRLACDASIVRMVLDPDSMPIDVGRKTRTIPPALRRALEHRDGGCVWKGCTATEQARLLGILGTMPQTSPRRGAEKFPHPTPDRLTGNGTENCESDRRRATDGHASDESRCPRAVSPRCPAGVAANRVRPMAKRWISWELQ
ncbi:hypothetical protein MNBD_ACTINO02-3212, partial [hydrothermal vent metagenome]